MGIASAFYTALSGLSVHSGSLSVIGNNLANLNTIGFKGSSTTFQDLFSTNLGASAYQGNGNPCQVGLGASIGAVMQNFAQSTFQSTSNPLDMAMQGQGFFYMRLVNGGFGHSRAGNFTNNQFGYVVDPAGNILQGYNRNSDGIIDTTLGTTDIKLPIGQTVPAFATSSIAFTTNLDATRTAPNDRFTDTIQVFDSLGDRHQIMITYERDPSRPLSDNVWQYYVWAPDAAVPPGHPPQTAPPVDAPATPGTVWSSAWTGPIDPLAPPTIDPGVPIVITKGKMQFGTDGRLFDVSDNLLEDQATAGAGLWLSAPWSNMYPGWAPPLTVGLENLGPGIPTPGDPYEATNPRLPIYWRNGAAPQLTEWVINTQEGGINPNFTITQTATDFGTSNSQQNGFGAGTVKGFTVDQNGFIIGTFTNGQTYPLAQVALSIFTNNNGLEKAGENIWKETVASGPASVGRANDVGRGSVLGSHYEMSNVDVADEFTRLIITQRGYQANSRIVTTSDEMMQETLALKR